MDPRIGYRRPLRTAALLRKKRLRVRLCIGAALAIAAVTACTWEPGKTAPAGSTAAASLVHVALNSSAPEAAAGTARRIYPYSIVPGGVATREDIVQRVKSDKVVAEHYASMNVALGAAPEGGLENTAFAFGDDVPGGNPTAFTRYPGFGQTNTGPVEPYQRPGMPSVPFSAPNGSGLVPTRYLTVSAPPGGTVAIPVTPTVPVTTTPEAPVTPPVTPVIPVTPVTPEIPVTPEVPVTPVTPVIPVTPVHVETPVTPVVPVPPGTPTADPLPPVTPVLPQGDIPEPGTLWLFGAALALLFVARKKIPAIQRLEN